MPNGLFQNLSFLLLFLTITSTFALKVRAAASSQSPPLSLSDHFAKRASSNPLDIDWNPAPSPEDGPPGAANALRDPAYLPAQIAGIVGSYAVSLVLVALVLLALSKKRREHLRAAEEVEQEVWDRNNSQILDYGDDGPQLPYAAPTYNGFLDEDPPSYRDGVYQIRPISHIQPATPGPSHAHVRNFSLPSPTAPSFDIPRFGKGRSFHEAQTLEDAQAFESPREAPSPSSYCIPSPTSTTRGPLGQDPEVPQGVVQQDRAMAQDQLEQMYRYVMEQEEAKEAGVEFHAPMVPAQPRDSTLTSSSFSNNNNIANHDKKEKNKPASLNLAKPEKKESRTSSILSALKSPGRKKKKPVGIIISSPIMTPMSGTFPKYTMGGEQEMNAITPRQYAPAMPPPPQSLNFNHSQASFASRRNTGHIAPLMTPPDLSPESTQSIDERIGNIALGKGKDREDHPHREGDVSDDDSEGHDQLGSMQNHSRHISLATSNADLDPVSAVSETSQSNLLILPPRDRNSHGGGGIRNSGLPTSPKPGVNRFPSLPASPKPGATFFSSSRANTPSSAVRTGGTLPLRAYENAMLSPGMALQSSSSSRTAAVKETVFQRAGPMSPGGMHTARTPMTGGLPVPYSPYQPFSPVVPVTPSLVTREDRRRMRKMEPKTPTRQMVKADDELW